MVVGGRISGCGVPAAAVISRERPVGTREGAAGAAAVGSVGAAGGAGVALPAAVPLVAVTEVLAG